MGFLSNLFGSFSARGKAMSLYKRGMEKADQRELEGAIVDYTAVIEMRIAPPDVKAMALLNRALAYSRSRQPEKADKDLRTVLAMDGASAQVKAAAHEKMERMKKVRSMHRESS